jgi:beta-mannosidase
MLLARLAPRHTHSRSSPALIAAASCLCSLVALILGPADVVDALLTQGLTGGTGPAWHVVNGNGSVRAPATVPGHVHLDLLAAGLIKDPYYRFEDKAQQWVALDSWTYSTRFSVDPCFVVHNRTVVLAMEGVDTAADITLNGKQLAFVANQHVHFSLPILGALVTPGANTLEVRFKSPVAFAAQQRASYPAEIHTYAPPWGNTENKTFVRKQQCDFGWDWGPALASVGVWRPASVLSYRVGRLTGATSTAELDNDGTHWRLAVKIFVEYMPVQFTSQAVSLTVSLQDIASRVVVARLPPATSYCTLCPPSGWERRATGAADDPIPQEQTVSTVLLVPVSAVDRWWPNGHGKQPLYNLSVVLTEGSVVGDQADTTHHEGHGAQCNDAIDTLTRRVGFRTAELVRDPDRNGIEYGSTFFLRINGRPIFAKGSSWVPADAFDSRLSRDVLRQLLGSAVEVRVPLLRSTCFPLNPIPSPILLHHS